MKYAALVRYVGTHFFGFQAQKDQRTVQGELTRATEELFGCPCLITGCSRTDSGVHAEQFCLTVEPTAKDAPIIPPRSLPAAILRYLPTDLSLYRASYAPEGFHPRYDAVEKEYHYRFRFGGVPDPFRHLRVWQIPKALSPDSMGRMQEAAVGLVGKHDFSAFMCSECKIRDHVRTIHRLSLREVGDEVVLSVAGDGFLYNMVRIIAGTLYEIGRGTRKGSCIREALLSLDRTAVGMTAPPDGLYLHRVRYPEAVEAALSLF